jgi:predicted ATPase/DNA-binding CsgD family transcriptional regulator
MSTVAEDGGVHTGNLPVALTDFIGRERERDHLVALVRENRLVTATGPGGVGKTRLCVVVAREVGGDLTFVDLATVTSDDMVVAAVADSVGVLAQSGSDRQTALHAALREREVLILLDNCEHIVGGARRCANELLQACPDVRILATSRTRLLLAGETVFAVPGLSIGDDIERPGDAVELFATRVAATGGAAAMTDEDTDMARAICERLDGMALGIELAAARVASFGVDGVLRALRESQHFLSVGHATEERHSSLRAAIDWSYNLLSADDQTLLRAASVFAAPFDLDACSAVTQRTTTQLLDALGRLVDWNLLSLQAGRPSRYRVLETIRQYAADRSAELGERTDLHAAHHAWIADAMNRLLATVHDDQAWCAEVDQLVDDARAAIDWASAEPSQRADAAALAQLSADVSFRRGRLADAQHGYERAADLTDAGAHRRTLLRSAAGSALTRYSGDEAVRLLRRIAAEAESAGDADAEAVAVAHIVTISHRHGGTMHRPLQRHELDSLMVRARHLSSGAAPVTAALAVAEVGNSAGVRELRRAERAVELARKSGNPSLVDAALDFLTAAFFDAGQFDEETTVVHQRLDELKPVPIDALSSKDHTDALLMGVYVDIRRGDLSCARSHADALSILPFLREEQHVGLAPRIEVDALAGRFDEVITAGERFRASWTYAGRPRVSTFASAASAIAMVHGMRDHGDERDQWLKIADEVLPPGSSAQRLEFLWPALFDGLCLLERDQPDAALAAMTLDPADMRGKVHWYQSLWLPWYAATWAEAAALSGVDDFADRLERARRAGSSNPAVQALLDRAEALDAGDAGALPAIADRLDSLGSHYQADRTREFSVVHHADAPRVPNALSPLSDRELEVLELVAAGRTNRQIAEALYISPKTAEHHVSNILMKLGVASRSEAAAMAGRHLRPNDSAASGNTPR